LATTGAGRKSLGPTAFQTAAGRPASATSGGLELAGSPAASKRIAVVSVVMAAATLFLKGTRSEGSAQKSIGRVSPTPSKRLFAYAYRCEKSYLFFG
jgi:hypothetical protein